MTFKNKIKNSSDDDNPANGLILSVENLELIFKILWE
jgi:hypothetical protein